MSIETSEKPVVNRAKFATGLGVLTATLGSAVGLGNIWKFPYLAGSNGGAAFLLVYIVCMLLIGIPVMISELTMGRAARSNAIATMQKLAPKKQPWWLIGAAGVISAFLIMAFYSEVAAWVFAYIFKAIQGGILSTDPEVTTGAFNGLVTNPGSSLIWQWIDLAVVGFIILLGVNKGIEGATKRLMPILLALLILVGVRSITLPGAGEGLEFLFKPDFSKLTAATFLVAMGLAFFKLSVGMGTMITYGSYFRDDQDIPGTAIRVAFSDLAVSLLAGIAIFPAVFAFGYEPNSGPSLLFLTIPSVFASMPLGNFFMVIFFLLTAIASIGAQISLVEVPVAFLEEKFNMSRKMATLTTIIGIALFGSLAALSSSTLADVKVFGMTFFDLFDYTTSNILLPLGGLFIAIFISWVWGYKKIENAISNNGSLSNQRVIKILYWSLLVVTPILITIVLLNGLKIIQ
ncbi:MAG: sodium-dependent transporter [Leptolinea sp.]|nr:sodium-dependent transporter [Leptolinea sp.]